MNVNNCRNPQNRGDLSSLIFKKKVNKNQGALLVTQFSVLSDYLGQPGITHININTQRLHTYWVHVYTIYMWVYMKGFLVLIWPYVLLGHQSTNRQATLLCTLIYTVKSLWPTTSSDRSLPYIDRFTWRPNIPL